MESVRWRTLVLLVKTAAVKSIEVKTIAVKTIGEF